MRNEHGRGIGIVKTDALDHHADRFLPGAQDAGWDLAAATVEFALPAAAAARLVDRYVSATGDRDIARRLPFYAVAYPAFRIGYCTLAREALGDSPDARRFVRDIERYAAAIPTAP